MIYRNAVALVMMLVSCRTATAFSMESTWERWWPKTRSAHLDAVTPVELPAHRELVALDDRGPVLDDGVGVWRTHKLSAGEGTISGPVWTRGGAIIGLDSHDGVVTIVPSSPATSVVRVDDSLFYTSDDQLVRYSLTTRVASPVARLGKNYEGALATDGRDVFVGDRDALWSWDVAAQQRRELDDSGLGPGELAIHGGALLVDVQNGHGAVAIPRDGIEIALDSSHLLPTGQLGWLGDNAVFVGEPTKFTSEAALRREDREYSEDDYDYTGGVNAILCWRAATAKDVVATTVDSRGRMRRPYLIGRTRRLYQTAPGVQICDLRASGGTLAWTETSRRNDCADAPPKTLVTARLRGACE